MSSQPPQYHDIVEASLNTLHQPALEAFWNGPFHDDEWGGRHRIVQDFAFLYSLLYEKTGDLDYRDKAISYLLDFGRGDHFAALLCGTAYEILNDDLTSTQRQRFATEWVAEAQPQLERYVGDPSSFDSPADVSNHAIAACVYADYAQTLFPAVSASYEYNHWTDPVWETWWSHRDFQEQATNYEAFTEVYLIHWADIRDVSDEFYSTPSLKNMFARNLHVLTPGGLVPPYGDSSYHHHQCKWIALFERLATDLEDGQYKHAAYDALEYFHTYVFEDFLKNVDTLDPSNDLYTRRLQYKGHLHEIAWLGLAMYWEDSTIQDTSRPAPHGILRRLPIDYVLSDADKVSLPIDQLATSQVALTGGTDNRTYLLVSVGPEKIHDHADAGAVQFFSRDETVLLGTNGYLQRELAYHNMFYAQPADWSSYPSTDPATILNGDPKCSATITPITSTDSNVTCSLKFERYHGLPITLRRCFSIEMSGTVTIRDYVTAEEAGYIGGPLFHAEAIEPVAGDSYRLRTETLRSMDGIQSHNPAGELHLTGDYPGTVTEVTQLGLPPIYTDSYQEFPANQYKHLWKQSYTSRLCLAPRRPLPPNEELCFTTHLYPHS